jgi:hypothetical protein
MTLMNTDLFFNLIKAVVNDEILICANLCHLCHLRSIPHF